MDQCPRCGLSSHSVDCPDLPKAVCDPKPEVDVQMTPRHWLAGMIMGGFLGNDTLSRLLTVHGKTQEELRDIIVTHSLLYADALITELGKKT